MWNEIKALVMVLKCPKAVMQHHNQHKIAVLWCFNDDSGKVETDK